MNKPHPPGKKKGKRSKRGIAGLPSAKQSKTPRTSLCVIFARTGQCRFGSKCRFKHDKSKLALCGRFLLGQCNGNCHLSHQVVDGNQPHCNYFQSNKCTKKKCPFAHVKVAADATFCPDFLAGYCDAGFDCPFRHVAPCIPFLISGNCKFHPPEGTDTMPHVTPAGIAELKAKTIEASQPQQSSKPSTATASSGKIKASNGFSTPAGRQKHHASSDTTTNETPLAMTSLPKERRPSDIYISLPGHDDSTIVDDTSDSSSDQESLQQPALDAGLQQLSDQLQQVLESKPVKRRLPTLRPKAK